MKLNVALLRKIKKHLIAEPKRYNQRVFADDVRGEEGAPACGTQACIAGWAVFLSTPQRNWRRIIIREEIGNDYLIANRAQKLLGLDSVEAGSLFDAHNQSDWRGIEGVRQACKKIDRLIRSRSSAKKLHP